MVSRSLVITYNQSKMTSKNHLTFKVIVLHDFEINEEFQIFLKSVFCILVHCLPVYTLCIPSYDANSDNVEDDFLIRQFLKNIIKKIFLPPSKKIFSYFQSMIVNWKRSNWMSPSGTKFEIKF